MKLLMSQREIDREQEGRRAECVTGAHGDFLAIEEYNGKPVARLEFAHHDRDVFVEVDTSPASIRLAVCPDCEKRLARGVSVAVRVVKFDGVPRCSHLNGERR